MKFPALTAVVLFAFAAPAFAEGVPARAESVKVPIGAPPVITAAPTTAADVADQVRLNSTITVTGDAIRLGDIFSGYLARPEKIVANAPAPGQRAVLTAEWLENLSRTYGLGWRPAGTYDRATVYQPGQVISQDAMLTALRGELTAKGLPAAFDVSPAAPLGSITVALAASASVGVREAYYDTATKAFSAVLEIPAGDPKAAFIPVRGVAYAVAVVPVLKENAGRNQTITAAMIDMVKVRAELVKTTTIIDPADLIGKTPKFLVKAAVPVQENDVILIRMVEVPALRMIGTRDTPITRDQLTMITVNAAELPPEPALDAAQLIGKTPRRTLAAGAPISANDVIMIRKVTVPALARSVARGQIVTAADLTTTTVNETLMVNNLLTDDNAIIGRIALQDLRAGQLVHGFNITRPIAIERGKLVTIIYSMPMMNLTTQGVSRDQGGIGDAIRVANNKSNTVMIAEVIDANTVRIGPKQPAASSTASSH